MSDLISRKAVMELIESKCTDGVIGTEEEALIGAYELITEITDMPTAFDVDKVVEQLKECERYIYDAVSDEDDYVINLDKAISIVKGGSQG